MPSEEKAVNGAARDQANTDAAAAVRLAGAIMEVAREMKRTVPVPRAAPYFSLDSDVAYDLSVLDSLSSRGIFRKYELVLLVRSGLGGTARWLARRLGCRILGLDADVARTRAARILNDRAGMGDEVYFAAGACEELPLRERTFTHVWMIDPSAHERTPKALREALRVLRQGAHFAVQVADADHALDALQETLAEVGFVDFSTRAAVMMPRDQAASAARSRLRAAGDGEALRAWRSAELAQTQRCHQIFCRRP